jgi:hypothetical protein
LQAIGLAVVVAPLRDGLALGAVASRLDGVGFSVTVWLVCLATWALAATTAPSRTNTSSPLGTAGSPAFRRRARSRTAASAVGSRVVIASLSAISHFGASSSKVAPLFFGCLFAGICRHQPYQFSGNARAGS